ncbi:hypothetical protein Tco_0658502 [Tanacetum coccineum]
MHNNIMAAGSKDRPPMLGPGRYSQWRSPVAAIVNAPAVPEHDEAETVHNMSDENKLYFKAEKEAIFFLLTGIGDEIYSTVDACNTANEMWTAIERLQQGESLNIQDVKTNLFWEFGKFTSRDGESMESYYSRFYKLMSGKTVADSTVQGLEEQLRFYSKDSRKSYCRNHVILIRLLEQNTMKLVKKTLLTRSQLEGYLKENTNVISDLKVKEEKDIDKMIEMDKRLTFANPRYLKKAQSEKPCLYEIPYDTSDPTNRFAPNREETMTLDNDV